MRCFRCIHLFNPHNSVKEWALLFPYSTGKETEDKSGYITCPIPHTARKCYIPGHLATKPMFFTTMLISLKSIINYLMRRSYWIVFAHKKKHLIFNNPFNLARKALVNKSVASGIETSRLLKVPLCKILQVLKCVKQNPDRVIFPRQKWRLESH